MESSMVSPILVVLVSFSAALDKTSKQTNLQTCISRAFVAIATSSGGIQTLIDKDISQDDKITTTKSESGESEVLTSTFKLTGKKR